MAYEPQIPILPGRSVQRVLDAMGMTQKSLAERTGLTEKHLSQIINGEASITVDTALLFENALSGSASFWINLEKNYQETKARLERKKLIEQETELVKNYPYLELAKWGYVEKTRDAKEKVKNLWRFFAVNSLHSVSTTEAVAYRKQDGNNIKQESLAAWLRCGEIESRDQDLPEYNEAKLKASLESIRALTIKLNDENFSRNLGTILSESGVGLAYVPHFTHTQVHGATRWIGKNPLIQLSIRGRDADKFWFTLFHEIGHVLKHGRKDEFIEFDKSVKNVKESEADDFAQKTLIPETEYAKFIKNLNLSEDSIRAFARDITIDPGILVGRLEHDHYLDYTTYKHLHQKLELSRPTAEAAR